MMDSGEHICPYCCISMIEVDYTVGNKKQLIECDTCSEKVWFRVFKNGVKKGWCADDQSAN